MGFHRRTYLGTLAGAVSISGCIQSSSGSKTPTSTAAVEYPSGSWPMIRHDPQNTGFMSTGTGLTKRPERTRPLAGESKQLTGTSAAVAGESLYLAAYRLRRINLDSGEIQWSFEPEYDSIKRLSAPLVGEGLVYVTDTVGTLYAIDSKTGQKRWETASGDVTAPRLQRGVIYTGYNTSVQGIDARTGDRLWRTDIEAETFVVDTDGNVFLSTGDGIARVTSGEKRWSERFNSKIWAPPVVADGSVYALTEGGTLYALDPDSGSVQWQQSIPASRSSAQRAFVAHDGVVYVPSMRAIDSESGETLWERNVGTVSSGPVADSTGLYVPTTDDGIYKLALENGTTRWQYEDIDLGTERLALTDSGVVVARAGGTHLLA